MDLLRTENIEKLLRFYIDNALNMASVAGVEADAEIKIRVIPNKDKNVDAKFVVVGSGKVVIPGSEEMMLQLSDAPEEVEQVEAEIVDELEAARNNG